MWQLVNIKAENIASFRELDFNPTQGVTTLIFGNNLDNINNSPSNGSGKSMLIEAVALAITGDPLRKIKIDELISDNADNMAVTAVFSNTETRDTFEVIRTFSRTNPQTISCRKNGIEQPQSSVLEYNRYVLDVIGLTKDEIYSNFILTQDHYASFFSASDKDKKAIINKFSNANMVDVAIEAVVSDQAPISEALTAAKLEAERINGAVEVLKQQLDDYDNSKEERLQQKEEKKRKYLDSITTKRAEIREAKADRTELEGKKASVESNIAQIDAMIDNPTFTLAEAIVKLNALGLTTSESWKDQAESIKTDIRKEETEVMKMEGLVAQLGDDIKAAAEEFEEAKVSCDGAKAEFDKATKNYEEESKQIKQEISAMEAKSDELFEMCTATKRKIKELQVSLEGAITCPKCSHQFIPTLHNADASDITKEVEDLKAKYDTKWDELGANDDKIDKRKTEAAALQKQHNEKSAMVYEAEGKLRTSKNNLESLKGKQDSLQRDISSKEDYILRLAHRLDTLKIDMLETRKTELVTSKASLNRQISIVNESIASAEGMIETYEASLQSLSQDDSNERERLQTQYDTKSEELGKAREKCSDLSSRLDTLTEQEKRFVRFKTQLANSKINALSQRINGILEDIGSDLRIRIDGYVQLKSGKIRDKMTVDIIKDGKSFGSYFKLSKGERTRIDVACIIAMTQLINSNCSEGKGLDLLIMDEILGNVDEKGLTDIYAALNTLHVTTLVVSHNPVTAAYKHTLTVCKKNGISSIAE